MITFKTKDLQTALKQLSPAIGGMLSVSDFVLLTCEGNTASLRASNLRLDIVVRINFSGQPCASLMPFNEVLSTVANMRSEEVSLKADGLRLEIKTDKGVARFGLLNVTDFPVRQTADETQTINIGEDFIEAIKEAVKHEDKNIALPVAEGCCINFTEDAVDVVGALQGKIFCRTLPYRGKGKFHVPTAFVNAVTSGDRLILSNSNIQIENDYKSVLHPLLEQEYIHYQNAYIPDIVPNLFFEASDLCQELNMILSYRDSIFTQVDFDLLPTEMKLTYANEDRERDYNATIPCQYSGECTDIRFNAGYLKSIIESTDFGYVKMMIQAKDKPAYIIAPQHKNIISPLLKN